MDRPLLSIKNAEQTVPQTQAKQREFGLGVSKRELEHSTATPQIKSVQSNVMPRRAGLSAYPRCQPVTGEAEVAPTYPADALSARALREI